MSISLAILLGIVEGFTEFLPISSTAHLLLVERFFNLPPTEELKAFTVIIQSGAMFAALLLLFRRIIHQHRLFYLALFGFLPTAILGFLLRHVADQFLEESFLALGVALFLGGVILLCIDCFQPKHHQSLSFMSSFLIGVFQTLALIPGVSRSGATIVTGVLLGISRKDSIEFSFLLGIPTIFAATGYSVVQMNNTLFFDYAGAMIIGTCVSGIMAYISMRWLLSYVQNRSFTLFGWYRILLGIMLILSSVILE